MTDHLLNACVKFKAETHENKLNFVKKKGLCFGCLRKGHMSSDCKKRMTCATCHKNHPPVFTKRETLRSQKKRREVKNRNPPKFARLLHDPSVSTSMIVHVWLSSLSKPNNEVLVYAILDKQSTATFILKETCKELDTEAQPTKLRLSTITSQDSFVDSQKVSSLQVRRYNSNLKIPIPVAFTSTSFPADEDHIPTKSTATNWDHLRPIESKRYIPHHGIYHPKKNKIRVVFDCSARFKGTSLNDHLLSGPDLTNNLMGVLLVRQPWGHTLHSLPYNVF